jgi:hypothetical protein
MSECTPSGDSFIFTQTITLTDTIIATYDITTKEVFIEPESNNKWNLLQAATPYTFRSNMAPLSDPTTVSETVEKTITTTYNLTFRRYAIVCTLATDPVFGTAIPGTEQCSDWYLGSGGNSCLDKPNPAECLNETPPFNKKNDFGNNMRKIVSITDKGFVLDPASVAAETAAINNHAQKIEAAIKALNDRVGSKITGTKPKPVTLYGYVPKTFFIKVFVNLDHEYDEDEGTSPFSFAKYRYNVKKTGDLLGWPSYYVDAANEYVTSNTEVYFKIIEGVPDRYNPYKYVCPPEWIKGFYLYGYGGSNLDALQPEYKTLYDKAKAYPVNIHDSGTEVMSGLGATDERPLPEVYGGQGVSILSTPEGPIGGTLYRCYSPASGPSPILRWQSPCEDPLQKDLPDVKGCDPGQYCGGCWVPTGEMSKAYPEKTSYSENGDCTGYQYVELIYGKYTLDKIYKYGNWEKIALTIDGSIDTIEDTALSGITTFHSVDCGAGPPTANHGGRPVIVGKGKSCIC